MCAIPRSIERTHRFMYVYGHVYIGIIPRSIEQILAAVEQGRGNGWTYTLEASFLEIYNEAVRVLPLAVFVYIYLSIYLHIYVYIYMYICIYVCTYIWIYTHMDIQICNEAVRVLTLCL